MTKSYVSLALFCMVTLFPVFAVANESESKGKLSDAKIRELMVGSWVVPLDTPERRKDGAIAKYLPDGTLIYKAYRTHACLDLIKTVYADWSVANGKLIIRNPRDANGNPVGSGKDVVDRVISINKVRAVMFSENTGKKFWRDRGSRCQQG